jgi:hypothetical protein
MAQQAGGAQAFSSTSGVPHANLFDKNTLKARLMTCAGFVLLLPCLPASVLAVNVQSRACT